MRCLRCDTVELEPTSAGEVDFVRCSRCGRHFRVTAAGALVERWPGPLSILLYPVVSDKFPQREADRVADELYASSQPDRRSIFTPLSRDRLREILEEVRSELEHPSQKVRDILDARGDEADLREYLTLVAKRLGMLLGEGDRSG